MERYTPGDTPKVTNFMARRTLATHGAFFRPFLFAGAKVLDCGCGPGTISADIATCVAPEGSVFGIDANSGQIELAHQKLQNFSNAECRIGSVYELPFESNTFDAAFSHALFEHLAEPERAARELWRVLKPGGVIGLRSPDWTGKLTWPQSTPAEHALSYYAELQASNGGDLEIGRKLAALLRKSGFQAIRTSATYECYSPVPVIGEYLAEQIEISQRPPSGEWSATQLAEELRRWCWHPDAYFAQAWCEVVAEK